MSRPMEPADEVESLSRRATDRLVRVINALARARLTKDGDAYAAAMEAARGLFSRMLSLSNLLGRRRAQFLYEAADRKMAREDRAAMAAQLAGQHAMLPEGPFEEAVRDILSREPVLAHGWEAVSEVYATRHAFALARSLDVQVTARVQQVIASSVAGTSIADPRAVIAEIGDWTQAYADTVYATNMATAYSAGMWGRLSDPDVAAVLPGAKYISAHLPTSRPNHEACHGLIAPTNSRVWDVYSPPLGYNCRCALREISIHEARREGLIQSNGQMMTLLPPGFGITAHPDPGFGRGRPDRVALFGEIGDGR